MPKHDITKLNRLYEEAESADKALFAEMRSNVLLVAGEHYSRRGMDQWHNRVRSDSGLSDQQKLRITKNHTHKIEQFYVSSILSYAPGVTVLPQNDGELQDQKAAELNLAVWNDAVSRYHLRDRARSWAHNFVTLGEVACKLTYDPMAGEFLGYEQQVDEEGNPVADEMGAPVADENAPRFSGGFVFQTILGPNLFRDPKARSMDDAEFIGERKMVDVETLKLRYAGDKEKLRFITEGSAEDFIVFDSDRAAYTKENDQVLVREFYFRPSPDYPMGWFYITTKDGILEEGELPFGVFPIAWRSMLEFPTSARGRSIIKVIRPYQAEINRASSSMALAQVTLGDDKILYQAGTKLSPGGLMPGVRGITYQGIAPTVLPGRDGSQFLAYIQAQVEEMYRVAMLDEELLEKADTQLDPYTMLYRSMRQQKRFAEYGEKFEGFLVDVATIFLQLARHYLPDDQVIMAVGRSEAINLVEWRETSPLSYKIKVEPQSDTVETKLGRMMTLSQVMQYVGGQLSTDDIGMLLRNMPYGNVDEITNDLTMDYDAAKNVMLAMDRGEYPMIGQYDNHEYMIRKLVARIRQPDFAYLPEEVQQAYYQRVGEHEQVIAEQAAAEQAAKNEYIPTDGAMIATDMYIPNPDDPTKPAKRVRIPYRALDWLVGRLESQGQSLDKIENMNGGVRGDVAQMMLQQSAGSGAPQSMPEPSAISGASAPMGVSG